MIRHPLTVLTLASALLAGCVGGPAGGVGETPLNPLQRYQLQVEPGVDRIALAVHEGGVSATQQTALAQLVSRYLVEGATELRIEAPSGGDPVSADMAHRVRDSLIGAGVPAARITVVGYAAPDPRAPVLAGFETVQAVVHQCGREWTNLTRSAENSGSANFGCAVTSNLAAQIENPRDIARPRGLQPSDAGRRAIVFDAWRKGETTSAEREPLLASDGRVSNAVN